MIIYIVPQHCSVCEAVKCRKKSWMRFCRNRMKQRENVPNSRGSSSLTAASAGSSSRWRSWAVPCNCVVMIRWVPASVQFCVIISLALSWKFKCNWITCALLHKVNVNQKKHTQPIMRMNAYVAGFMLIFERVFMIQGDKNACKQTHKALIRS